MSAVIQIRTMKLGEGIPKICIPLTDKTTEGLAQSLRDLNGVPFDFAEWRADFFDGIEQPGKRLEALRCLRDGLGSIPCSLRCAPARRWAWQIYTRTNIWPSTAPWLTAAWRISSI